MVSTSPLRTVMLWPTAWLTSVSAAVAPTSRAVSIIDRAMRSRSAVETGKCAASAAAIGGLTFAAGATFVDMVMDGLLV